jgi:hypothetical protein
MEVAFTVEHGHYIMAFLITVSNSYSRQRFNSFAYRITDM